MSLVSKSIERILSRPKIWRVFRAVVEKYMSLYETRQAFLDKWGLLDPEYSTLDVGCGTGDYCRIVKGPYWGVDVNGDYIEKATDLYGSDSVRFLQADVADLALKGETYDVVLFVDILHHLDDELSLSMLKASAAVAGRAVALFEPVAEQQTILGRCMVALDRGKFIRPSQDLLALVDAAGLRVLEHEAVRLGATNSVAVLCVGQEA